MRYFDREAIPRPRVFESERFLRARQQIELYLGESDQQRQRQRRAPYDPALLKHPDVRQAMLQVFGQACAFCESDTSAFDFIDIEHHRPKFAAVDQKRKSEYIYYVWLAYEWDNIFPICRICNTSKRDKFYVAGKRGRIGASVHELREQEESLLLDPCFHDVSQHLSFDLGGTVRPRSEIGKVTIDLLALNREALVTQRRRHCQLVVSALLVDSDFGITRTGLPGGWGSSVIAETNGEPLPYAGGTTLALLEFAAARMPQLADLDDLLARLRRLSLDEKRRFLVAATGSESERSPPPQAPAEQAPPPPKVSRGSRLLQLSEMASAERPIRDVRIRNFKALASIDLALPEKVENPELVPCMLVLGENATGKSSVLEAVALALLGTREASALDGLVAADAITPGEFLHRPDPADWDVVTDESLSVDVRFLGIERAASIRGLSGEGEFAGTEHPSKIVLGYGPRRYFPRHLTRRFRAPAHRARSLFDPMTTITNPIGWLRDLSYRDPAKFDAAARALRIVLMLKDDALIQADGDRIMIDTAQGRTPLEKLSVGYKSVIAMAIDIIRELFTYYDNLENAHAVVLVDEIETHLHPRWKLRIVGLLRQAFPKVQFILTTHDPLCLRGIYQGEVFVLRRSDEDNTVKTLIELPNVQGMRAEQILTSEFFGLGSTDPATDAKVERYQYLTTQPQLSESEQEERLQLVGEIESRMMVGTTLEQQTDAEAARLADLDAPIALTKVQDGDRRRMIEAALTKLQAE